MFRNQSELMIHQESCEEAKGKEVYRCFFNYSHIFLNFRERRMHELKCKKHFYQYNRNERESEIERAWEKNKNQKFRICKYKNRHIIRVEEYENHIARCPHKPSEVPAVPVCLPKKREEIYKYKMITGNIENNKSGVMKYMYQMDGRNIIERSEEYKSTSPRPLSPPSEERRVDKLAMELSPNSEPQQIHSDIPQTPLHQIDQINTLNIRHKEEIIALNIKHNKEITNLHTQYKQKISIIHNKRQLDINSLTTLANHIKLSTSVFANKLNSIRLEKNKIENDFITYKEATERDLTQQGDALRQEIINLKEIIHTQEDEIIIWKDKCNLTEISLQQPKDDIQLKETQYNDKRMKEGEEYQIEEKEVKVNSEEIKEVPKVEERGRYEYAKETIIDNNMVVRIYEDSESNIIREEATNNLLSLERERRARKCFICNKTGYNIHNMESKYIFYCAQCPFTFNKEFRQKTRIKLKCPVCLKFINKFPNGKL